MEHKHFIPWLTFYSISQFLTDFFIGNKSNFFCLIISKISQMDHISQYIILTLNINSVIFECCCINFDRWAGKHFNDCCFQAIIIHVDKRHNRFIRGCFRPVTLIFSFQHYADNSSGIINLVIFQQISIIPFLYLIKILMVLIWQLLYFSFRKSDILRQNTWTYHGKFIKIV